MKASKRFAWGLVFFVLAGGLLFAQGPSAAEKLSFRLPEGTVGFIATSGAEQLKPAFDQSSIGQLWNNPGVQSFYAQTRDAIVAKIKQEMAKSGDAGAQEAVSIVPKLACEILQCPIAVGFINIPTPQANEVQFGAMILVEAGKRKQTIQPLIKQIEALAGKDKISDQTIGGVAFRMAKDADDIPTVWGWVGDRLVVMVNHASEDWLKGLVNPPSRPSPLVGLPDHGDLLVMYGDVQKISQMIGRSIDPDSSKQDNLDKVRTIMDTLGLRKVQSISARAGFSGKDLVMDEWVKVPAPHTGIWTAVKPVDRKLLARTDARSMTTSAWNIDLATLYDVILKTVNDAMETDQERQDIQKGIADLEAETGIKIRQGLLASLDGSVVVQAYPSLVMKEVPAGGFALVVGLKDAALFEQHVKALIDRFGKDLKPDVLQIRSGKLESGQTQTFLISPMLSLMQVVPNWVIADNRLILTTNPTLTTILIKQYAGDKPASASLGDDKDFQALTAKVPANANIIEYGDTAVSAKELYQQIQQFWPMVMGMASGQGLALPVTLPDLSEPLSGMGKSIYYGSLDAEGFRTHYQGSGVEVSSLGIVTGGAVAAAITLPAMDKARNQARNAVSMNNLKQIGLACMMYTDDHQSNFPPNLDALLKEGILTEKVLQSPRKPKDFSGPSYVYIGGQKTSDSIENILAYEEPSLAENGKIAVLFLDGHCEIVDLGRFQEALKKTYKQLGRPMPEQSEPDDESKKPV